MPFVKGTVPIGSTPFKKGVSGNPGGRPKGVKKQIRDILTKHLPDIEQAMDKATPENKMKALESLATLVKPLCKSI